MSIEEELKKKREEREKAKAEAEKEAETRRKAEGESAYISKIIAAINPSKYCDNAKEVKKLLKEKSFWDAVEEAEPKASEEHILGYDSASESLEPVYFWILDKMNDIVGDTEKLIDNFVSSPGSGHFSELMSKATRMQEESMKMMQTTGVLIKSMINIIYDLKEFEIRLSQYNYANSKDKAEAEAGLLSLKQIWMDNVDIKRGRGSINMLAQDLQFVMLRDAFMAAKSMESISDIDLNDRVRRMLQARLQEFLQWRELSERELRKRYEIEKTYLKNQLNSLKLYTRWAKPYLKAATQLEQKEAGRAPDIVTAFNTIRFELTLLGKKSVNFSQAVIDKKLPESFRNIELKRKYYSCVLVDFYFRGIPQKVGQHYAFGGKVVVAFRGYALNRDELKMLDEKLDESDLKDSLTLVSGMTDESLRELQEDISYFLKEEKDREELKEKEKKSGGEDANPFSALFGIGGEKKKEENGKKDKITEIKADSYVEEMVRKIAEDNVKTICFTLFDVYKKAHGMASHPSLYD